MRSGSCIATTARWLALPLAALSSTDSRAAAPAPTPACRDRFLEPFSSGSIWNTAIGSAASFSPAHLFADPERHPSQFHNDQDFFLRVTVDDPLTAWISQGDWGADDKCAIQGKGTPVAEIRLPYNWTTASDCDAPPLPVGSKAAGSCGKSTKRSPQLLVISRFFLTDCLWLQVYPLYPLVATAAQAQKAPSLSASAVWQGASPRPRPARWQTTPAFYQPTGAARGIWAAICAT